MSVRRLIVQEERSFSHFYVQVDTWEAYFRKTIGPFPGILFSYLQIKRKLMAEDNKSLYTFVGPKLLEIRSRRDHNKLPRERKLGL